MKKAICILLAAILLTGTVSGCAVKEENPPETTEKVPALSVEQAVLFEKPYATVSAQAITQTGTQYKLELTVNNTGTERLEVRVGDAAVNGLNVPAECSGYFPTRVTGTVDITLDCSTAFLWGMDKLETMTFTLCLETQYSYDAVPVTVRVFQEGSCGSLNMDGTTVLEQDGVTVQYKIVDDWPVYLLVNNTDSELNIYTDDLTINGISEYYPGSIKNWVKPGQTIVTGPNRVSQGYIPTAETMEIAFKIRVRFPKSDTQIISDRITHVAPFTIDNWGLSEELITAFDNGKVQIYLVTSQSAHEKAADLCIWIRNNSDEELVVEVPALSIDGRKIPVYETDKIKDQYYFRKHTVKPHTQVINTLTYGECGTPEMYGGIREVYLPISLFLGDEPQTVDVYDPMIQFPKAD